MLETLFEHFLKPLIRVLWSIVKSLFTFNFKELKTNIYFRLPFVLVVGPYLCWLKFWLTWYKLTDQILMDFFGVFDPASTAKRIIRNFLCPNEVVKNYRNYIDTPEFREKRIKFSMQP
jgi:hypothetical protein